MMLHLVRHPPVAKAWQKRCYGQSDPGLSREGQKMVAPLVDQLVALKPDIIIHSDMVRTRAIATLLADRLGLVSTAESLWRERYFGAWEGTTWNAIYRATGNAMDGMIDAPDRFRPGGGETTAELMMRVQKAMDTLPKSGLHRHRYAWWTHRLRHSNAHGCHVSTACFTCAQHGIGYDTVIC